MATIDDTGVHCDLESSGSLNSNSDTQQSNYLTQVMFGSFKSNSLELQTPPADPFVFEVFTTINYLLSHWLGRMPRRRLIEFAVAYGNALLAKLRDMSTGVKKGEEKIGLQRVGLDDVKDAVLTMCWTADDRLCRDAVAIATPMHLDVNELLQLLPEHGYMFWIGHGYVSVSTVQNEQYIRTPFTTLYDEHEYTTSETMLGWLTPDTTVAHVHIMHRIYGEDGDHIQYFVAEHVNDARGNQQTVAEFARSRFGTEKVQACTVLGQ